MAGVLLSTIEYEGQILDGRHRAKACALTGIEPQYVDYAGNDPQAFVIARNLSRRHLNESQRALVAAKLANMAEGRPGKNSANWRSNAVSQADAAARLNVGARSVQRARVVVDKTTPEIVARVEAGEMSVSEAVKVADLPKKTTKQRAAIAAEMATMRNGSNRFQSKVAPSNDGATKPAMTTAQAAAALNVSTASVERAKKTMHEDPAAHQAAKQGTPMKTKPKAEPKAKKPAALRVSLRASHRLSMSRSSNTRPNLSTW